jgi:biofilm protein TabA
MAPEATFFEAHRANLDIHVPLEGVESIGYTPLDDRVSAGGPVPVFQGDDITYAPFASADVMTVIRLVEGMYALFGPDDVHMPKLQTDGPSSLRKIVIKVPVASLPPPDDRVRAAIAQQGSALSTLLDL